MSSQGLERFLVQSVQGLWPVQDDSRYSVFFLIEEQFFRRHVIPPCRGDFLVLYLYSARYRMIPCNSEHVKTSEGGATERNLVTPLGRPRSFDRQTALRQAMDVFWALGYEAATLADLQKAMGGISAPSFYAAFGSKEALFREAVELYSSTLGAPMLRALAERHTARASVEALLRAAVRAFRKPGKPRGCMLVLAAMNSAPGNRGVAEFLRGLRSRRRRAIEDRLRRAMKEGEVPATLDAAALASFYATVIDGLAIQARDGASPRALEFAVQSAMNAWDASIGPVNRRARQSRKSARTSEG